MSGHPLLTRRLLLAGAALTPLVLIGCGGQAASAGPPAISFGRDTCDRCGMIISDERFAAALTGNDGEPALFDDVGEMIQTVAEEGLNGRRAWAHDRGSTAWIDATTGIYLRGDEGSTPMGTGVMAFADRASAEAFSAERGGDILTWDEVIRDRP